MPSAIYFLLVIAILVISHTSGFSTQSPLLKLHASNLPKTSLKHQIRLQSTQLQMNRQQPPERKIMRETEGDYFESEFDRKPLKERLPIAFGVLAGVSFPFIIGLIYLYANK